MTPTDALRQLLDEYQGFDMTDLTAEFGMNKALRIRNARAALAAAEKDESELVAAKRLLAAAKAWAAAGTADIDHCTKETDEAAMDAEDELREAAHEFAKHAAPPKE